MIRPDQKLKTYRNPKYLDFVRSHPCLICGKDSVAHHESATGLSPGAMGKKCSDLLAIPLCPECHQKRHDEGYITFWVRHGGMVGESPFNSINRLIADGIAMREIIKLQMEFIEKEKR